MSVATRNFRLFLAFRGSTRALLFAPYILHFMTGVRRLSFHEYGLLQLVYYWVAMACEVPSGIVADRLGRKTTLLLGALVNGLGCFCFAAAYDFWVFGIGEVLFAMGTALISGADSAMLYDSFAAEGRQSEYARAEGAGQAVWLIVTAVGLPLTDALLVRGDDPVLAYWITGVLSMFGALCAMAMVEPPIGPRLSARDITVGAIRDVIHRRAVWRLILYSVGLFILLRAAIVIFFNPVLKASGVPVRLYGTTLALVNVVGAAAALKAHKLTHRFGERAALLFMPLSLVFMFSLIMFLRMPAVVALFCIQGAVFGAYPLVVRTILNRNVTSAARRATVISLESMACRIGFGLLVAVSGWCLEWWDLSHTIAFVVAAGCLPFLILALTRRKTDS